MTIQLQIILEVDFSPKEKKKISRVKPAAKQLSAELELEFYKCEYKY